MQQKYSKDARWEVSTGKQNFSLTGEEAYILKRASEEGNIKLVWFDKFAVSIPHIVSVSLVGSGKKLPPPRMRELTDEERRANMEKMNSLKSQVLR